jgi:hypothetical protein
VSWLGITKCSVCRSVRGLSHMRVSLMMSARRSPPGTVMGLMWLLTMIPMQSTSAPWRPYSIHASSVKVSGQPERAQFVTTNSMMSPMVAVATREPTGIQLFDVAQDNSMHQRSYVPIDGEIVGLSQFVIPDEHAAHVGVAANLGSRGVVYPIHLLADQSLQVGRQIECPSSISGITSGVLDKCGNADLLAWSHLTGDLTTICMADTAHEPTLRTIRIGPAPISASIGDFGSDRVPNIVFADLRHKCVSVLSHSDNVTPIKYSRADYPLEGRDGLQTPRLLVLSDVDGDGALDAVTINDDTSQMSIVFGGPASTRRAVCFPHVDGLTSIAQIIIAPPDETGCLVFAFRTGVAGVYSLRFDKTMRILEWPRHYPLDPIDQVSPWGRRIVDPISIAVWKNPSKQLTLCVAAFPWAHTVQLISIEKQAMKSGTSTNSQESRPSVEVPDKPSSRTAGSK